MLTAVNNWYKRHARTLPWRISPADRASGATPDPYRVWLSEVMLQQTTAPHAGPYFLRFVERWPTVASLAAASWEEVSAAWAGLGYYSRARNLHACAKAVATRGGFPQTRAGLAELPGVGPYTAAAIAAIAFAEPAAPVDANIERVVSRLFTIGVDELASPNVAPSTGSATEAARRAKRETMQRAQTLFDEMPEGLDPGDIAQALMDIGSAVCTPRAPACGSCPLSPDCAARRLGVAERLPLKAPKAVRPTRFGSALIAVHAGAVLLVRRPPEGLLGGMLMPPGPPWSEDALAGEKPPAAALSALPVRVGEVRHVFTHFALRLSVWRGDANSVDAQRLAQSNRGGDWIPIARAVAETPTVARKALLAALHREELGAPDLRAASTPNGRRSPA